MKDKIRVALGSFKNNIYAGKVSKGKFVNKQGVIGDALNAVGEFVLSKKTEDSPGVTVLDENGEDKFTIFVDDHRDE